MSCGFHFSLSVLCVWIVDVVLCLNGDARRPGGKGTYLVLLTVGGRFFGGRGGSLASYL